MKVMARLGHASCACARFDAQAIPSASASAPTCFIEFSYWLSEPDKQVPCRCANLWNRDLLASAATWHAQALQPVGWDAAAPFGWNLGRIESPRRPWKSRRIEFGNAPAWPPVETMSHGHEKRSLRAVGLPSGRCAPRSLHVNAG